MINNYIIVAFPLLDYFNFSKKPSVHGILYNNIILIISIK